MLRYYMCRKKNSVNDIHFATKTACATFIKVDHYLQSPASEFQQQMFCEILIYLRDL